MCEESLGHMAAELDDIAAAAAVGEVYARCLAVDRHLAWHGRLWAYFREKWDQRDDPHVAPVLASADEIVWSTYAPPFRLLGLPVGPPPLPYMEAELSPHAVPRSRPPGQLRPSEELLCKTIARMPVAVIGIPELCTANPWWLIVLPHEVGHQLAYEIDDGKLPARVASLVTTAASSAPGGGRDAEWPGWAHELFADGFAAAMVGSAHLWAIAELEQGDAGRLVRRSANYPPPLVRHAVTTELLRGVGPPADKALPPMPAAVDVAALRLEPGDRERVEALLEATPFVAAALAGKPTMGELNLRELAAPHRSRLARDGRVGRWKRRLSGSKDARPEAKIEAPRLAAVGAVAEWVETMAEPDGERRRDRAERLRQRMLSVVPRCREPGVRAAGAGARAAMLGLARATAREAAAVTAEHDDDAEPHALLSAPDRVAV